MTTRGHCMTSVVVLTMMGTMSWSTLRNGGLWIDQCSSSFGSTVTARFAITSPFSFNRLLKASLGTEKKSKIQSLFISCACFNQKQNFWSSGLIRWTFFLLFFHYVDIEFVWRPSAGSVYRREKCPQLKSALTFLTAMIENKCTF